MMLNINGENNINEEIIKNIIYIIIIWNLITFSMMGIDKFKAIKGFRRISENTLLTVAFSMGAFGSIIGSFVFRHKTQKLKFKVFLPLALLFNVSMVYLIWYYLLK